MNTRSAHKLVAIVSSIILGVTFTTLTINIANADELNEFEYAGYTTEEVKQIANLPYG